MLRFSQPPFDGELTVVRLFGLREVLSPRFGGNPPLVGRIMFWIFCGAHNYMPIFAVESLDKHYTFAKFYRCTDRRSRGRTLAVVGEVKSDRGAIFLVNADDFKIITQRLSRLKQEAEKDTI